MKNKMIAAVLTVVALAGPASAWCAPSFPEGPVRLIVPFPPGGPTDAVARMLAEGLQALWTQPVIVENKPGAGTIIGIDQVAKAAPDGRTIGLVITGFAINPSIRRSMPYDTLRDLQGITQIAESKLALVASADAPFNSVAELIELAKKQPGKLTYASPGAGTSTHLAGELFKSAAGIDIVHVPYKGSAPAQTDLIGGQVDIMFDVLQSALPMVKSGRLKVIALASAERDSSFPNVPTVSETVDGYVVGSMFGLVTAAAVPQESVDAIASATEKVMRSPKVTAMLGELGMKIVASPAVVFNAYLREEVQKWQQVVQANGISID
ncbi:tripartite tricarboxylate transporter substrate binding protein [Alcaligenaceae bacterium C4P045]|nr:tripartite tricarboxylate transporter substrate binding protein [Alcaligenaceae bacterium B3P038]MDQ2147914.1 tripartite tricarboxylate transporter substrate binding protein [Alcaligenaceae bacterium C4P045]